MSSSAPSSRTTARGGGDIDLTDLEIIRRYSLAVRQDSASRDEVLAALRSDVERLEGSGPPRQAPSSTGRPSPQSPKRSGAKRAPAKRSARG